MSIYLPGDFAEYAPAYLRAHYGALYDAHVRCAGRARREAERLLKRAAIHDYFADEFLSLAHNIEHPDPKGTGCLPAIRAVRDVAEDFSNWEKQAWISSGRDLNECDETRTGDVPR